MSRNTFRTTSFRTGRKCTPCISRNTFRTTSFTSRARANERLMKISTSRKLKKHIDAKSFIEETSKNQYDCEHDIIPRKPLCTQPGRVHRHTHLEHAEQNSFQTQNDQLKRSIGGTGRITRHRHITAHTHVTKRNKVRTPTTARARLSHVITQPRTSTSSKL